jgi:hypothetical protein
MQQVSSDLPLFSRLQHIDDTFEITFSKQGTIRQLAAITRTLRQGYTFVVINPARSSGTHSISPVTLPVFDPWVTSHPQFPHSL